MKARLLHSLPNAKSRHSQLTTLGSKWTKTKILMRSPKLHQYVPDTMLFTFDDLQLMLDKHQMVYVKPVKGSSGNGVIKVVKKNTTYSYHVGMEPRNFPTYKEMFRSLIRRKYDREYIVQQGIRLLTYDERIFDIRIMVQKNEKSEWETTGYIGRLAHPKKIVTNFHNSGKPMTLEQLMSPYLQDEKKAKFIESLRELGHQMAVEFHTRFPAFKEIGIDLGLDSSLKPWIIEVNTRPDAYIFNQLKDKQMFRRVISLKRWNGLIRARTK